MSEDKLHSRTVLGSRAQELYQNETFSNACKALEAEYLRAWGATHINDTAGREALWALTQNLGGMRRHLALVMADGKLAKAEIEQLMKRARQAA